MPNGSERGEPSREKIASRETRKKSLTKKPLLRKGKNSGRIVERTKSPQVEDPKEWAVIQSQERRTYQTGGRWAKRRQKRKPPQQKKTI